MNPLFRMNVFGWICIFSTIVLPIQTDESDENTPRYTPEQMERMIFKDCTTPCGGLRAEGKPLWEGEMVCYWNGNSGRGALPCKIECKGLEPAEDQAACWCDLCKGAYFSFCKEPGLKTHIEDGDCKKEVCSGKGEAKFRGPFCSPRDEKSMQEYKTMYGIK